MKTTLDIEDELLIRAKKYARRVGKPLRAVVEESLREMLTRGAHTAPYEMPDASAGDPSATDPLELLSWQDLRAEIYGEPDRA